MPSLARKVLIAATVDGLFIQPLSSKKEQRPSQPVRIHYGDAAISFVSKEALPDLSKPNSSFEAFGIVGLITVSNFSYLVSITRRQQVAQIRGFPVYVITEVALTPCSTYSDASESVAKTATQLQNRRVGETADDDTDTDPGYDTDIDAQSVKTDEVLSDNGDESAAETDAKGAKTGTSVVQDVMSRRGSYGRFAQRWFSRSGWQQESKRNMGLSQSDEAVNVVGKASGASGAAEAVANTSPAATGEDKSSPEAAGVPIKEAKEEGMAPPALLAKLLRTTQIVFGSSQSYFFSYDYDITRCLSRQQAGVSPDVPLYQRVDPVFFWNHHVIQPFIDAGVDSLTLPLMKGFVGQRAFTVDSQPAQMDEYKGSVEMGAFGTNWSNTASNPSSPPNEKAPVELRASERQYDLTVISRRSIKRAGLRYLRRGIDEAGWCANSVETEQLLSPKVLDADSKVYSFLQIRGSIPVFFMQSPYSLKPTPVLQHSDDANLQALKKHFDRLHQDYGSLQIANLVEKHGVEAPIGEKYQKGVQRYNEQSTEENKIPFEWFDFHDACRGMKFENVQKLIETLKDQLDSFGSTVRQGGDIKTQQAGVIRTNCMDCLDRTNVCQSSFAKYVLDAQLKEQGFDMTAQSDQVNSWFNTLWADNGDAISKQYASTAAMKGDYTRTKKRDYRGALTDAGLGLTRFFNGMVNDFFLQATIDFLLGNVTSLVFDEFETNMMTKDPAVSIQKMRDQAIELCRERVVADKKEEFIDGWTFLSPAVTDSITASPFQEVVLLLTDTGMYICRFDWNLDKVSSFDRVDLSHVQHVKFGTYITSTLSSTQTDESKNVGLVITYKPGSSDYQRVNTRTLSSLKGSRSNTSNDNQNPSSSSASSPVQTRLTGLLGRKAPASPETKKIALKAPYTKSSIAEASDGSGMSESQLVTNVCQEIERLAFLNQPVSGTAESKRQSIIEEGDIVSLAEAKRNVGIFETLGYSIKRLVWA